MIGDYYDDELRRGDPVTVYGNVARRPGPHRGVVLTRLMSGRVRVLVLVPAHQSPGRVIAIVDPDNLAPRVFRAAPVLVQRRPANQPPSTAPYVRFHVG